MHHKACNLPSGKSINSIQPSLRSLFSTTSNLYTTHMKKFSTVQNLHTAPTLHIVGVGNRIKPMVFILVKIRTSLHLQMKWALLRITFTVFVHKHRKTIPRSPNDQHWEVWIMLSDVLQTEHIFIKTLIWAKLTNNCQEYFENVPSIKHLTVILAYVGFIEVAHFVQECVGTSFGHSRWSNSSRSNDISRIIPACEKPSGCL